MFLPRALRLIFTILCIAASIARSKGPAGPLSSADRRLFAWFDQIGIEGITHARLVRVRDGPVIYVNNNERQADEPRGFLLWEKDGQFRVLLGDLTAMTLDVEGTDPSKDDYVGWRAVSLDEETAAILRTLAKKEVDGFWDDGHDIYSDRLDLRAQAFVLARYCHAQGRDDLAGRLLRRSAHLLKEARGPDLKEALAEELGDTLRWRATLALVDPQQDRHAIAALFRKITKECPHRRDAAWIEKMAADLERMAVEDEAHPKIGAAEFERLSPAEQARELVFQLRNEYAVQDDMWRRPWPFEPTQGNGSRQKLAALGLPAVPALLEAMKDDRPSRSVLRNIRYGGGAWLSTIQDLAIETVNDIAGVNFMWLVPDTGSMPIEEHRRLAQALVEDWWKTTQEQGESAWLRARVVNGEEGAQYCLAAIAKHHPEALTELAVHSIPNMASPRVRAEMLELLKKVNTPEVNQLLLNELTQGPSLRNRVAAAYLLRERHQPEALGAMLAEFAALPKAALTDSTGALSLGFDGMNESDSPGLLLNFLLSSDSTLAVRAVREILPQSETRLRGSIVEEAGRRLAAQGVDKIEPAGPETRQAVAALLISELQDDGMLEGSNINGLNNPKVAEIAAWMLAGNWPDKYEFDWNGPAQKRAIQLATIRRQVASEPSLPAKPTESSR